MMKRTAKILATATIAGALAYGTVAHNGVNHDGAYAEVDDLVVTGGAGELSVSGSVSFGHGDGSFTAFEDAGGDSTAPAQGLDITKGTITQDGQTITFRMDLTDMPLGDVQPGALYNWDVGVTGAGEQRLFAWRNNANIGSPGEWTFSVVTFDGQFFEAAVPGEFTGSSLVWNVTTAQISGSGGGKIGAGTGPITASQGGFGFAQLTSFVTHDTVAWSAETAFTIGGGVNLNLTGPNGFDEDAKPRVRNGAFASGFTDLAPGVYTLTITSGFADAEHQKVVKVTVS